jgi:hypothetical protein
MTQTEGTGGGLSAGRGQRRGRRSEFGTHSVFQKSTLGGTLFAFASMLIGNWLDKKLSKRKEKKESA